MDAHANAGQPFESIHTSPGRLPPSLPPRCGIKIDMQPFYYLLERGEDPVGAGGGGALVCHSPISLIHVSKRAHHRLMAS